VLGVGVEYFYFEDWFLFSLSRPRREREGGQYVPPQPSCWTHPQCCGSGMFIPYPGSPIPDPKTAIKQRGEKKFDVIPFYVATSFTKLYIILV
jgi:hypothetical protein